MGCFHIFVALPPDRVSIISVDSETGAVLQYEVHEARDGMAAGVHWWARIYAHGGNWKTGTGAVPGPVLVTGVPEATASMENTTDRQLVAAADDMNTENFCRHMNLRHGDRLAAQLWHRFLDDGTVKAFMAFHRVLHRENPDLGHTHEEGQ